MKFKDIRKGMIVEDRWFWDWGLGKVVKKLKTVAHIHFPNAPDYWTNNDGNMVFDVPHCQFLEKHDNKR